LFYYLLANTGLNSVRIVINPHFRQSENQAGIPAFFDGTKTKNRFYSEIISEFQPEGVENLFQLSKLRTRKCGGPKGRQN
jgi:hypothetical protein